MSAIGTISSAISATPMRRLKGKEREEWENISELLEFAGNSFQAIGNIISAFLGESSPLEVTGEIIQSSGNITVLFSLIKAKENIKKAIKLSITGNSQQAFGALLAALDELTNDEIDITGVSGNFLQSIGNTLQAIAGLIELELVKLKEIFKKGPEDEVSDLSDGVIFNELQEFLGEIESNELVKQYEELVLLLKYSGSWIQAAGSIVTVYAEQKELNKIKKEQTILEKKKLKKRKDSSEKPLKLEQKGSTPKYSIVRKKSND
ncbi:hypothetical protein OCB15_23575 [Bacillus cereus]|nr:hypothetical protein [Bacillus cereus]